MSGLRNLLSNVTPKESNAKRIRSSNKENHQKNAGSLAHCDGFITKFESNLQKNLHSTDNLHNKEETFGESQIQKQINSSSQNVDDFKARNYFSARDENLPSTNLNRPDFTQNFKNSRYYREQSFNNQSFTEERINVLNKKIEELDSQNSQLRSEILKVKTDAFKKYEQLKKNNDELLLSYEERSKVTLRNFREQHELEIKELKEEIERLHDENARSKLALKQQKEKMSTTLDAFEAEKQELSSKIRQLQLKNIELQPLENPFQQNSEYQKELNNLSFRYSKTPNSLNTGFSHVLKQKEDVERRYNDLFNSYNILLQHNKMLSERVENIENQNSKRNEIASGLYNKSPKGPNGKYYFQRGLKQTSFEDDRAYKDYNARSSALSSQGEYNSGRSTHKRQSLDRHSHRKRQSPSRLKGQSMVLENTRNLGNANLPRKLKGSKSTERLSGARPRHNKLQHRNKKVDSALGKASSRNSPVDGSKLVPQQRKSSHLTNRSKNEMHQSKIVLKEDDNYMPMKQSSTSSRNMTKSGRKEYEPSKSGSMISRSHNNEANFSSHSLRDSFQQTPLYSKIVKRIKP